MWTTSFTCAVSANQIQVIKNADKQRRVEEVNMRKSVLILGLAILISGCDSANQMIDKAQETANQKVESLQSKIEKLDIEGLNSELFKNTPQLVSQLTAAINDASQVDFNNPVAVEEIKGRISNIYACLVDASSASSAQGVMDKLLESISNAEMQQLIESGIAEGKNYTACVK